MILAFRKDSSEEEEEESDQSEEGEAEEESGDEEESEGENVEEILGGRQDEKSTFEKRQHRVWDWELSL